MVLAVIGTRNPQQEIAELCKKICRSFCGLGLSLVTGNADGIDSLARDIWNEKAPEKVTLILPWPDYNRSYVHPKNKIIVFTNQKTWTESVKKYHPAVQNLSSGGFKLHARNYGIIENTDVVVAFPSNKLGGGGTGQGIRIAGDMGKPLFVLPRDLEALRKFYLNLRREFLTETAWKSPAFRQGIKGSKDFQKNRCL